MKIAIVVSDFNEEITSRMEKKALEIAQKLKVEVIWNIHVPGAFEVPIIVKKLLKNEKVEGIVTLGAVIQGETNHDVVITNSVGPKLLELSLKYNKPVGLGIIGPKVTWKQAEKRAEEYAERAVETVIEMIKKIR